MNLRSIPPLPVRPFTLDEYHRMIAARILTEADDVELLEGWIVPKVVRTPLHDTALDKAGDAIREHLPEGWRIRDQKAITLSDSEPEPDLAVVRAPVTRYRDHHPGPEDIALLIEVAVASLNEDRVVKGRMYARARISCYWIVNLVDGWIEVYSDPDATSSLPCYRQRKDHITGMDIPLTLPGAASVLVPVDEILLSQSR